ncbi:MAG TPA: DNA-binding domain-containing protein [Steroidobacteraceae bacterium]|jgi:hypothetical protein
MLVPPELASLQGRISDALLEGAHSAVLATLANELGLDPLLLAIHANTVAATLGNALALSFPAVRAIVGADFFEGACRQFIARHPPQQACLHEYGQAFPLFLAQFPPARELHYLADVARLEWAVNRALNAPEAPGLNLDALAALPPERMAQVCFVPHPALSLLRLATPADEIWRAVLAQNEVAMRTLDVRTGPVWLLVERNTAGVQVQRLEPVRGEFLRRLCAGEALEAALESAGDESLANTLAEQLAAGRFTHWMLP